MYTYLYAVQSGDLVYTVVHTLVVRGCVPVHLCTYGGFKRWW